MKMRKITALTAAIIAFVAAFAVMPSIKTVAHAEEDLPVYDFVYAYSSYDNTEIVKKVFGVKEVKDLSEDTLYFAYKKKATDEEIAKDITASSGKTEFESAPGEYVMSVYTLNEDKTERTYIKENVAFNVVDKTAVKEDSLHYVDLAAAKEAVAKYIGEKDSKETSTVYGVINANSKKVGDSFAYPDLSDLLVSEYFGYSSLKSGLTLHYCQPNSSSFTSTSSKSFKLSAIGKYSFYVTGNDPIKRGKVEVDTDKHERKVVDGVDGWFVKDTEELVCPIFTFELGESGIKAPRITLEKPERSFIGLLYKDVSSIITVEATDETTVYELYFSEDELSSKFKAENADKNWNDDGIAYLEANAKLVEDDADEKFDKSTLNFTPQKQGYYYVVCKVGDGFGTVEIVTDPIRVAGAYTDVVYEREFLKNNWVSMVFLGIAVLSFIGLMLVIFIKPKDKNTDTDVVPTSKK